MKSTGKIKTVLCSFGMSGRLFHGPFLKVSPHYVVTGVLERTKQESRQMFPDAVLYRSVDDLVKDDEVELVIVNTPNFTHFDFARRALEAGKHVVVEKPFTITTKEGLKLKELAEKKNRILSVYHNRRFDSDFLTIKKVIDQGYLGEIVEVEMRFDRYRLHPGKKLHKETPGPGTGNLYDLGSHLLDQAIQLFGMPDEIFADIDIVRKDSRVDDYFEVMLYYENLRVRLHSTYLAADELPGYVFFGTHGSFIKPKSNIQEEELTAGKLPGSADWGKEPPSGNGILTRMNNDKKSQKEIIPERGNYGTFYDMLYAAIRKGKPVPVTPEDAIRVVYLIELAYQSSRLKKVVSVKDLVKYKSIT